MKHMPLFIVIPGLALFVAIASVFAWQMGKSSVPATEQSAMVQQPTVYDDASETADSSPETDSSSPVADLEQELETTVDDGGASDFSSLEKEASGL